MYGQWNRDAHYCKHCETSFRIEIHEHETGDFFLQCPTCKWRHYRRFEDGVAIHCELRERKGEPMTLVGRVGV